MLLSKQRPFVPLCFSLFLLFLTLAPLLSQKKQDASPLHKVQTLFLLGDYYYNKQDYPLAQIEYKRALNRNSNTLKKKSELKSKLALSLLHQDKFLQCTEELKGGQEFDHLYLSMFAALRLGWTSLAIKKQAKILISKEIANREKEEALLLGGTAYLEQRDYKKAEEFYLNLKKQSKSASIIQKSSGFINNLDTYYKQSQKTPWLSGIFSTIIPGSGQIYSEHYTDGIIAFFFNVVFISASLRLYKLEQRSDESHYYSAALGLIGLNFYFSNISSAVNSARRYNQYQERKFHHEVRNSFFNIDYIEKTSNKY